jgi:hypothetical protein
MTYPIYSRLEQDFIDQMRQTIPPLAIEPIASEGNPDWTGPYEKAPLSIYPNQSDLECEK